MKKFLILFFIAILFSQQCSITLPTSMNYHIEGSKVYIHLFTSEYNLVDAPIIVKSDRSVFLLKTNEEGVASFDYEKCDKYMFIYCPVNDFENCKKNYGINEEFNLEGYKDYDTYSTFQTFSYCPFEATSNNAFCVPLVFLLGLLFSAMFYIGRNPLDLFDITVVKPKMTPRYSPLGVRVGNRIGSVQFFRSIGNLVGTVTSIKKESMENKKAVEEGKKDLKAIKKGKITRKMYKKYGVKEGDKEELIKRVHMAVSTARRGSGFLGSLVNRDLARWKDLKNFITLEGAKEVKVEGTSAMSRLLMRQGIGGIGGGSNVLTIFVNWLAGIKKKIKNKEKITTKDFVNLFMKSSGLGYIVNAYQDVSFNLRDMKDEIEKISKNSDRLRVSVAKDIMTGKGVGEIIKENKSSFAKIGINVETKKGFEKAKRFISGVTENAINIAKRRHINNIFKIEDSIKKTDPKFYNEVTKYFKKQETIPENIIEKIKDRNTVKAIENYNKQIYDLNKNTIKITEDDLKIASKDAFHVLSSEDKKDLLHFVNQKYQIEKMTDKELKGLAKPKFNFIKSYIITPASYILFGNPMMGSAFQSLLVKSGKNKNILASKEFSKKLADELSREFKNPVFKKRYAELFKEKPKVI